KRREKGLAAYPLCVRACGQEMIIRYFDRHYDLHPVHPGTDIVDQVLAFGRYLAEIEAVDGSLPPYTADLARYERAINELRHIPIDDDDLRLLDLVGSAPDATPDL